MQCDKNEVDNAIVGCRYYDLLSRNYEIKSRIYETISNNNDIIISKLRVGKCRKTFSFGTIKLSYLYIISEVKPNRSRVGRDNVLNAEHSSWEKCHSSLLIPTAIHACK